MIELIDGCRSRKLVVVHILERWLLYRRRFTELELDIFGVGLLALTDKR